MCGINGIVNFREKVQKEDIDKMNKKIKHRGPDDEGIFVDNGVGLGHVRLSILDLSFRGHQPMLYESRGRRVAIVFNGEIYNFKEIKESLIGKGYKFKSTTDTEVVLASYLEYGKDCVTKFNGMFAFVVYDFQRNVLFGARDRLGKKPLKYYLNNKRFLFSSELKALLTQKIPREIDYEAVNNYLTLQYVPSPRTGFKGIFKLPHASYFFFNCSTKQLEIKKYWELDYSKKVNLSSEQIFLNLEKKLEESVKKRLIADVEVGAFLSGGVDSSAVVAFATKHQKKLKTFTIKFKEKEYDESEYARKVSREFNTDHHEFLVESGDMHRYIEKLIYQYEEPYGDSSQLPTFILAKKTSKYVKVVLNGDGGDENFGGYDKYEKHLFASYGKYMPGTDIIADVFKNISSKKNSFYLYKIFLFLKTVKSPAFSRHINYTHYFDVFSKYDCYKDDFKQQYFGSEQDVFRKILPKDKFARLDNVFFLDFNTYVPDDLMVKVDIATMANGLESRSPLLDYEFVEMCARIPYQLKINLFQRKRIFKKILEKHLSKEILYRKKKGFGVPINDWFRGELKDYVREVIMDKNSPVLRIMKREKIEKILTNHYRGEDNSKKLWVLMSLNLWNKQLICN